MPRLQKGYKNKTSHRISIEDDLIEWVGWPLGPYGPADEEYDIMGTGKDKEKVIGTAKKGNRNLKAPYITVEQDEEYNVELIQAMSKSPDWTPNTDNGGITRRLILTWTK